MDRFLKKTLKQLVVKKASDLIGREISNKILQESIALEKVLLSEASVTKFYSLPSSRYNSIYLIASPEKLLRIGAFEKLSEMAKFDFTSSCRCLLYGEGTASAFHVLRAIEDTLKHYYFKYVKSRRLKAYNQTWGALSSALKMKKVKKPPKAILDSLDLIRVSYRNPTQHPQIKYDIESAEDLFGLGLDLINKMTLEL